MLILIAFPNKIKMNFDKSSTLFTSKENMTFIGHCSVSPLYSKAADIAVELMRAHEQRGGAPILEVYMEQLNERSAPHPAGEYCFG